MTMKVFGSQKNVHHFLKPCMFIETRTPQILMMSETKRENMRKSHYIDDSNFFYFLMLIADFVHFSKKEISLDLSLIYSLPYYHHFS